MIRRAHGQPVAARAYRSEPDTATPRACPGPQRSSACRGSRWCGLAGNRGRARPTPQTYRLWQDERMAVSILLVDDDDAFRSFTAGMLRAAGHERVYEERTVAGALRAAVALRPDVALVDIGLPDGDGFEVAGEIAQLADAPRVVLISADAGAADDAAALRVGAIGFVAKEELEGAGLRGLLGE